MENNPVLKCHLSGSKIQLKILQWRRKWSCSPLIIHSPERHTLSTKPLTHSSSLSLWFSLLPSPSSAFLSLCAALNLQSPFHCLRLPSPPLTLCMAFSPYHMHTLFPKSFKVKSTAAVYSHLSSFPSAFLHVCHHPPTPLSPSPPCSLQLQTSLMLKSHSLHHCWTLAFSPLS